MSTPDSFDNAQPAVRRDRWGRPVIVPPEGGKPVAYTRCTTYVDVLDDKYNLARWQQRMVAVGLVERPDLLLAVSAHRDDKSHLNKIVEQALEAAKGGAPATTGTALHAFTEQIDRQQLIGTVPAAYVADLDAYRAATACLTPVEIEQFTVHDRLKVGGTPDRIVDYRSKYLVADVKTGSIDYSALKIAMQLAVYAHSIPYDVSTGERLPREYTVDTDQALVIHLPAGEGRCELHWVDIATGWEAVQVAGQVREFRARRNWFTPFHYPVMEDALADCLATAGTVDELRLLWTTAVNAGTWTDHCLAVALARKAELERIV